MYKTVGDTYNTIIDKINDEITNNKLSDKDSKELLAMLKTYIDESIQALGA